MTYLANDEFDMCCGGRPAVTSDKPINGDVRVECGVCGAHVEAQGGMAGHG